MDGAAASLASWAGSGAMALTGPADGPPSPAPARLAPAMSAAAGDLAMQTARWGRSVVVDGPALLGERAAISGMTRNGDVSVGGAARFLEAADGWVALNLPRPEDVASLPALIGRAVAPDEWPTIAGALRRMERREIVERATWLGLAVGVPGEDPAPPAPGRELHRGGARTPSPHPLIVDLSSLWAGPLTTSLLAAAGARVIKIEGRTRPDGARRGATAFFDLLQHGKEMVTVDFQDRSERRFLHRLLRAADLVVEASRPRVMDGLGVAPDALADAGTSWLSLTAHGRNGPGAHRIGFGDDAAVSGGLLVPGDPPMFVADAVADPVTGLVAAALAAELIQSSRAAVVEVPLARAAAWAATGTLAAPVGRDGDEWFVEIDGERVPVRSPVHRPVPGVAASLGAHDARIREEFATLPG